MSLCFFYPVGGLCFFNFRFHFGKQFLSTATQFHLPHLNVLSSSTPSLVALDILHHSSISPSSLQLSIHINSIQFLISPLLHLVLVQIIEPPLSLRRLKSVNSQETSNSIDETDLSDALFQPALTKLQFPSISTLVNTGGTRFVLPTPACPLTKLRLDTAIWSTSQLWLQEFVTGDLCHTPSSGARRPQPQAPSNVYIKMKERVWTQSCNGI